MLMLKLVFAAAALAGLVASQGAAAGLKPPAGQSEPRDRDSDERAQHGPAARDSRADREDPPSMQPTGRYIVLTEGQKRCGAARGCEIDSRIPCPPCW